MGTATQPVVDANARNDDPSLSDDRQRATAPPYRYPYWRHSGSNANATSATHNTTRPTLYTAYRTLWNTSTAANATPTSNQHPTTPRTTTLNRTPITPHHDHARSHDTSPRNHDRRPTTHTSTRPHPHTSLPTSYDPPKTSHTTRNQAPTTPEPLTRHSSIALTYERTAPSGIPASEANGTADD